MRRDVGRRGRGAWWREAFLSGAAESGVMAKVAERIFAKFYPHYTLPEGHALTAFTAYRMAWLRRYHPLDFYVALFNGQPIGVLGSGHVEAVRPAVGSAGGASLSEPIRRCGIRLSGTTCCGWGYCCRG